MLRNILDNLFSDRRLSNTGPKRLRSASARREWARRNFLRIESLENRSLLATLGTDLLDYAPGTDVTFTGTGFGAGETIDIVIDSSNAGGSAVLTITDGGELDTDGAADGNFTALWNVGYDNVDATLVATATGESSSISASTTFTDSNSGSIDTTLSDGSVNNGNNQYALRTDVYFKGKQFDPGTYSVEVYQTQNNTLVGKSDPAHPVTANSQGIIANTQLWSHVLKVSDSSQGYDFSANGVYRAELVAADGKHAKTDNFKVDENVCTADHDLTLTADFASVSGLAGSSVTMTGTYSDASLVTLTASSGTVTKNNDGTWTWTGTAPASSNPYSVTITASDGPCETKQVSFSVSGETLILLPPAITVEKTVSPGSVSEGGVGDQQVTYTYKITNTSPVDSDNDPVTITSIVDDVLGNLLADAESQNGGNTIVLAEGASFSFTVTVTLDPQNAGAQLTNTVTVNGNDDENEPVSDTDDATVDYTDVKPAINVVKSASPTSVSEGGVGNQIVTYTYLVTNTSDAGAYDPLSGVSLSDTDGTPSFDSGDDGDGILQVGETWVYTLTVTVPTQNAGASHTNTVTATGTDDEGNKATDDDTATVTYTDVAPSINVEKTPNATVIAPGGTVTFTYLVTNTSAAGVYDPLSGVSLSDTDGTPTLVSKSGGDQDNLLEAGETWKYSLTVTVQANNLDLHTNTVTATGKDDEGNTATDTDSANVVVLEECGGRTIGYWRNGGNSSVTAADFTALNALNLRNADGTNRDFVDTLANNKKALADWLKNADATNMAYMLSAQLTALKLSVLHGYSHASDYVYVPALNSWSASPQGSALLGNLNSGPSGTLTTAGFLKIETLIAKADTALGNDLVDGAANSKVVVSTGNSQRKYYEALKVVTEAINYSYLGSGADPGPICISTDTFDAIMAMWHDDDNDKVIDPGELG